METTQKEGRNNHITTVNIKLINFKTQAPTQDHVTHKLTQLINYYDRKEKYINNKSSRTRNEEIRARREQETPRTHEAQSQNRITKGKRGIEAYRKAS